MQGTASAIFLIAYAFMRLLTGIFADRFHVKLLYVIVGLLQSAALGMQGLCVFYHWPQVWSVALHALVGLCLASNQVLEVMWCCEVWGPANSGLAIGMINMGFASAAILGPVSVWWSLCQLPSQGNQAAAEVAFALWLWTCSILTIAGVACITPVRIKGEEEVVSDTADTKV